MVKTVISVRDIPVVLWKRFRNICKKKGLTLPFAVIEAISDWIVKNS